MQPLSILILALVALAASWYLVPTLWAQALYWLGRRLAGVRVHRAAVDGVRWQWLEGGGGPALVLLHGLGAQAEHWLAVARELRGEFRLLIPDLPGFGASEPPANLDFHIAEQSRRVERWLDRLGIRDCVLAGNSMGGWIASDLATRSPRRVRALWLQDPFGVLSAKPSEILTGLALEDRNPFDIGSLAEYRELAELMFRKRTYIPYPLLKHGYARARRLSPIMDRIRREILSESEAMETLAPRLTMPVFLQWGTEDRAVDSSGAQVLRELMPRVETDLQQGVGHLPMLESPRRSSRAFMDFARRHALTEP